MLGNLVEYFETRHLVSVFSLPEVSLGRGRRSIRVSGLAMLGGTRAVLVSSSREAREEHDEG